MTPQTNHSMPRLQGPISGDGAHEEDLKEEVKTDEDDLVSSGNKSGISITEELVDPSRKESPGKLIKGRDVNKRRENAGKEQTLNDGVVGKNERDKIHSDMKLAVGDPAIEDLVVSANVADGDINAVGDLVAIYGKKDVSARGINKKMSVRKNDKKCSRKDEMKMKDEKRVGKVPRRGKTCWGDVPLASPFLRASYTASSSALCISFVLVEKIVVIAVLMTVFSAVTNIPVICAESMSFDKDVDPVFLEPVPNVTVAVGRDASLTCAVDHLGLHKVAWIHLDRQMIVSIHNHVITRQPRFTVTHDSHKTWTLQVTRVMEEDRGHYMCQVNTKPMISQTGFLQVVVPPNIVDKVSSKSNIVVREKDNVTLVCRGEGFPLPQIKWRREDGQPIETSDGRIVHQLDGPDLILHQVSRTHMGSYLCIATNGVPPSVSKRITLDVEFAPQMHVPNQLVGSPLGTEVRLECFVEAHPRAITYWEFLDSMVMNSSRKTTHTTEDRYKIHMILTIGDLKDSDFGMYKCISKNSIAETDGSITLNKTLRPTSPPQTMLHGYEDEENPHRNRGRQGRKELHMKQLEDTRRRIQKEEEKRIEEEESRRRAKDMERQRLEHDFDRGQRNEQATRVTHTQSGCDSLPQNPIVLAVPYLLAFYLQNRLSHIY